MAAATVMIKLPAASALLDTFLIGGTGGVIAPFAIHGSVIGRGIRLAGDHRDAHSNRNPIEQDLHAPNR